MRNQDNQLERLEREEMGTEKVPPALYSKLDNLQKGHYLVYCFPLFSLVTKRNDSMQLIE